MNLQFAGLGMKCNDLFFSTDLAGILNQEEKELLQANSTLITYNKGECLVKKGEFVTDVIYICSGYVKVHLDFERKNLILSVIGNRKFLLLGSMVFEDIQPFNLTAIEETTVYLTNIKVMRDILLRNPNLSGYILKSLNHSMLSYVNHNLVSLTQNNIHGRLAHVILYLAETVFHSNSFDILLSRKELSELCNISRENVIKVLYEFDRDGIIQLQGKSIHINSLDTLRKIANHG
jgi:CRP-like cAMP-binding protein